jgi:hypothetical protein
VLPQPLRKRPCNRAKTFTSRFLRLCPAAVLWQIRRFFNTEKLDEKTNELHLL